MSNTEVRCLLVEPTSDTPRMRVSNLADPVLRREESAEGEVTIAVHYSSLNYKDALACTGHKGVVKSLPHIPGIDAAGVVVDGADSKWNTGDEVLVTGYDLGQGRWGGWSQCISVPSDWIVPKPQKLTLRETMIFGTAGFTAAQSLLALRRNDVLPECGEVVVTGATGGVGSLSVRILAKLGYEVVAVTGKPEHQEGLLAAGASRVISRQEIIDDSTRPLLSSRWAGAIDTVGGSVLTSLLRSTKYGGCVTACGLVAGANLDMTVYPFLLRGVSLCGIASADCPYEKRLQVWELLSNTWKPEPIDEMLSVVTLDELPSKVEDILGGRIAGRTIVDLRP